MTNWGRLIVLGLAWCVLEVSDASRLVFLGALGLLVGWFMQTDINRLTQQLAEFRSRIGDLEGEVRELQQRIPRPAASQCPAPSAPVLTPVTPERVSSPVTGEANGFKVFCRWLLLGVLSALVQFWPQINAWFRGAR
jgi:hypothetical protein